MLFIADWYWSGAPATSAQQVASTQASNSGLRIQSERKWPDKVVFDTTIPTITPPPPAPPVVAAQTAPSAPVVAPSLDARAEMKQGVQPVPPPKRQVKVHHRNVRPADSTWAAANPNAGWSWNW
jgi:hypothetical protein